MLQWALLLLLLWKWGNFILKICRRMVVFAMYWLVVVGEGWFTNAYLHFYLIKSVFFGPGSFQKISGSKMEMLMRKWLANKPVDHTVVWATQKMWRENYTRVKTAWKGRWHRWFMLRCPLYFLHKWLIDTVNRNPQQIMANALSTEANSKEETGWIGLWSQSMMRRDFNQEI